MTEIQPLHRVAGYDDALQVQQSPTLTSLSEKSLPLKPEKEGRLPAPQTPSRTEGSGQTSSGHIADYAGSMVASSQQGDTEVPHAYPQNDLDKAIEQAQATKDLVSVGDY